MKTPFRRRGGALIAALVTLLVVTLVAAAVVRLQLVSQRQLRQQHHELQAQWLAESAIGRALTQLAQQADYAGETWQPTLAISGGDRQAATVAIRIETAENAGPSRRIVAIAHYPNHEWQRVTVRREYTMLLQDKVPLSPPNARAAPAENAP